MSQDYKIERDAAAEKKYPSSLSYQARAGFKAGWEVALTESSVVLGLIEMIKCQQELLTALHKMKSSHET